MRLLRSCLPTHGKIKIKLNKVLFQLFTFGFLLSAFPFQLFPFGFLLSTNRSIQMRIPTIHMDHLSGGVG
jgi:hypothetical protein